MGGESKETHQQSVIGWDYCLDVSSGKYIQNNLYLYVLRVSTSIVFWIVLSLKDLMWC